MVIVFCACTQVLNVCAFHICDHIVLSINSTTVCLYGAAVVIICIWVGTTKDHQAK